MSIRLTNRVLSSWTLNSIEHNIHDWRYRFNADDDNTIDAKSYDDSDDDDDDCNDDNGCDYGDNTTDDGSDGCNDR